MNIGENPLILSEEQRKKVDEKFGKDGRLDEDAINAWPMMIPEKPSELFWEILKPIEKYKDYLIMQYDKASFDYVISKSDPEAILELDRLIDEFNADFERIKEEKNCDALLAWRDRAVKIIREKKV